MDTDISFRQQRIDLLKVYRGEIALLAEPRIALFDLDLAQWARMQDECAVEVGEHRKVIERKLAWLREVMQTEIPGGNDDRQFRSEPPAARRHDPLRRGARPILPKLGRQGRR
jgi:hypothetical protein